MAARLASMSVDALLKLRNEIGAVLSSKAAVLKKELAALGEDSLVIGRSIASKTGPRKSLSGTKVPPKYRGPSGETWAGRGATPVWLREAIKAGKKAEDFLIAKGAKKSAAKMAKRAKKKRVAAKRAKKSANNVKTKSSGATTYSYRI